MAVPSWKKRAEKRPPDLDDCVEQLQLLSDERSKSVKTLGQVYVAALGLIYHLRLDQETIFSIRYVNRAASNKIEYENYPWNTKIEKCSNGTVSDASHIIIVAHRLFPIST
jgi:hypothetical protein